MAVERQVIQSQAPKCQVQALTKRYGTRAAIDNISFDVAEGEFVVLLGPSGCGKTTTLRLVAGLASPDEGRVLLDGKPVSDAARDLFQFRDRHTAAIGSPDQSADARSCYIADRDLFFFENFEDADVRDAASKAATQRDSDARRSRRSF